MKKIFLFTMLALFSFAASAQSRGVSTSSYPVFDRVYQPSTQVCEDVVVQSGYNAGGAAVGAVVGYMLGREIDRDTRSYRGGYYGGYGYGYGRGGYYNDRRGYYGDVYESRVGRYGGAVAGVVIGGNAGRTTVVSTVCREQGSAYYREVLVGYRIVTRYPDGSTYERFEPVR
jgi:hypothetical protein